MRNREWAVYYESKEYLPRPLCEKDISDIVRQMGQLKNIIIEHSEVEIPHPFNADSKKYGRADLMLRGFGRNWLCEIKATHQGNQNDRLYPTQSAMKTILYTEIYNLSSRDRFYPAIMVPAQSIDPIIGCALYRAGIGYIKYKQVDEKTMVFDIEGMRDNRSFGVRGC